MFIIKGQLPEMPFTKKPLLSDPQRPSPEDSDLNALGLSGSGTNRSGLSEAEEALGLRAAITVAPDSPARIFMLAAPGLEISVHGAGWINPESLDCVLKRLRARGVTQLLALTEPIDLPPGADSLLDEGCKQMGINTLRCAIPDFSAPTGRSADRWRQIAPQLHLALDRRESIAICCMFGAGRSGMKTVNLLMQRGAPYADALATVRALYPRAVESQAQMAWLASQA